MQAPQGRLIEALVAVDAFLAANQPGLEAAAASPAHQHLAASRQRMVQYLSAQNAHARARSERVAEKRQRREELVRDHLRPIAAVAQSLIPAVGQLPALRAPRSNTSSALLLAQARGMANAAQAHEAAIVAAGRPADFLARLDGAITALESAVSAQRQVVGARVEATEQLYREAQVARRALRTLDVLVRSALQGETGLLARWTHIRRVASGAVSAPLATPTTPAPAPLPAGVGSAQGSVSAGGSSAPVSGPSGGEGALAVSGA